MAEIIEDGTSGVIVESADADRLADAMIRLYNAPAEDRRAMGRAAQARIRENYHPDVIAADIEGLYADYIKTHPYRPAPAIKSVSKQPTVAIVVPCYNHGQFLPETLESIRNQTYPNVECVVVDDGSTDPATLDALRQAESQGVRVIRQENSGLAAARNAGVRKTDSPFFVPLDADDRIAPDFVAKLLPALLEDASLGYSYSHVTFFGSADGTWACPEYDPRRLLVENLCVATAVVRRAAFDEAGGYQADMSHGFEDWDFWLALLGAGYRGRCTPEPLFHYRKHAGGSMLSETQKHRRDMVQTMIGHHRALFGAMLETSLGAKDEMFFSAHMEAHRLREQGPATPVRSSAYEHWAENAMAQAELDFIENSRAWRLIQKASRVPPFRWIKIRPASAQGGDNDPDDTPRHRLERLRASRGYRSLQAVKNLAIYRWYARRKYGRDYPTSAADAMGASGND